MINVKKIKLAAIALAIGSSLSFSTLVSAATEIKVAFNQSDKHPQYIALEDLGKKLSAETDGRYEVKVYPNALLGDQRAALELLQNGAIQMAMVANPLAENYDKSFRVIGLPYVYNGSSHQETVFTSGVLDELFSSTEKFGFEVLTAYTAGARSMYTKNGPVKNIADMKGQKIRVMQSDTMIKILDCMGGTGVPMSQGEVYSAVQQGVLDGAENNEITYVDLKQYEVAPYFSATRHLMMPDLLAVSSDFISSMSDEDQATLRRLAKESTPNQFKLWSDRIETAKKTAQDKGATFNEVDIKPFQQSCQKLQAELLETPEQKALFKKIVSMN